MLFQGDDNRFFIPQHYNSSIVINQNNCATAIIVGAEAEFYFP